MFSSNGRNSQFEGVIMTKQTTLMIDKYYDKKTWNTT